MRFCKSALVTALVWGISQSLGGAPLLPLAAAAPEPRPIPAAVGVSGSLPVARRHASLLASVPGRRTPAAVAEAAAARGREPDALLSWPVDGLTAGRVGDRAPAGVLGAQQDELFWTYDFHLATYYPTRAALAVRSDVARVYVEHGLELPAGAAEALHATFVNMVAPAVRDAYGPEPLPGMDGDPAITVLLLDIRDALYHRHDAPTYFSGYFDPVNQRRQVDLDRAGSAARSNEREMLYVDVAPPSDPHGRVVRQTLAHEMAHLVQWAHGERDADWLVEGLSELAVHLSGLGHPREHVLAFLDAPAASLITWDGHPRDYGKVYLFLLYLYEQVGEGNRHWLRRLVQNQDGGIGALAAELPLDRPLPHALRDFAFALHLDLEREGDGRYGFRSLDLASGPTAPDTFPMPRLNRRTLRDADRGSAEHGPWSFRSEGLDVLSRGFELEMDGFTNVCLGATLVPRARGAPIHVGCTAPGTPIAWRFERPAAGAASTLILLTVTNGNDLPTGSTWSVVPDVGIQSAGGRLHVPLALAPR